MENWLGLFLLMIIGAVVNLGIAFVVFRVLAGFAGIPREVNTPSKTLYCLVTIIPVAGVAGAPFWIMPFVGPVFGTLVSAFVAPMMLARELGVSQGDAAKVIVPTVVVVAIVSAVILFFGIPMVL
ncbi:MAG: hypothetical protein JRH19_17660 [Deltaproteobacteria bacterium]|nr:hypothetical protein [Deltaproteobacteria bacterium]